MNRDSLLARAAMVGVILGGVYSLSPLTALSLPVLIAVCVWAARDLTADERRWFTAIMAVAIVARLITISGLFLFGDSGRPFEVLFGDELFFKNRSLWIRNIGLGVPISPADVIYAFEDVGISSYLYGLAVVQALVGKAPYGIHVLNSACYAIGALLLFRIARRAFGGVAALFGLTVLLFTPSLFMWSISAIKEPSYVLVACAELACALMATRATSTRSRVLWFAGVVAGAIALESLRRGGGIVAIVGVSGGYFFGWVLPRPRLALATVTFLPIVVIGALMAPPIQERVLGALRTGAFYHAGHVLSEGHSYHALSGDYYREGLRIYQMPVRDVVTYVARSYLAYVTEPVPWRVESRAQLAYLPEQMLWFVLLALAIAGIANGFQRDPMLTMLLLAHAFGGATVVAVSSGNIGTLIRHRGLIMPYLVWLAGLGLYQLVKRGVAPSPVVISGGLPAHGRS
ncbi:MAG TPA: glycosyltransferase family 39 protein [Vicinamibacterales bacterium]|nr:glycosyltransferase family 39 protein [Vicinamibacterales bacterium]